MSLRRSPKLTPAALAARRANALKSTGPRTARGKAWSSLNGLRHGWDARDLRAKLERTGDKEALLLFDWIFTRFFELCSMDAPRCWSYHLRLAARVWCHITGRILLPRVRKSERKGWSVLEGVYRYGGNVVCPRDLKVLNYRDVGIRFINPYPCRRKHVKFSWIPRVEYLDPPPRLPRARRVRQCKGRPDVAPGPVAHAPLGAGDTLGRVHEGSKDVVGPKLEYLLDSTNPSTNSRTATRPTGRWARLAQLVARVWASAGLADWERTLGSERADGVGPKPAGFAAERSKDVVGRKLECALDSTNPSTNSRSPNRAAGLSAELEAELAELTALVPVFAGLSDLEEELEAEIPGEEDPPDREFEDERLDSGTAGWDDEASGSTGPELLRGLRRLLEGFY